jgi:hypothetical protein
MAKLVNWLNVAIGRTTESLYTASSMSLIKELLSQPNWKDSGAIFNVDDAVGKSLRKGEPFKFYGRVIVSDVKDKIEVRFDGGEVKWRSSTRRWAK